MAFRQLRGPFALLVLATLAAPVVGCSLGRTPSYGFLASDLPSNRSLPGDPVVLTQAGQTAPLALPGSDTHVNAPESSSPLALAMARADSYYERGLQAMRSGNTNQAEWEFDAALETLVDTGLTPTPPPRLAGANRWSPTSFHGWLSPPAKSPGEASAQSTPPDPDEPTQEAPALLDPDDVPNAGEPGDAAGLPEPDVQKYEFPIAFNDQVKTFIQYFQTKKWGVINRGFERASRYLPMMRQTFREKGLPVELLNLAFIESAVNPWATSRAKAAGIWQFMTATARLYGMQVSWWVDERRDPEKATRGAADYLKNLYQMFGAWELALAAYNAGEGTVQRAIDRQQTRDFWKLRLPKETQLFVPAFMAMTIISKEPDRYGFSPPPEEPFETHTVTLDHPVDFHTLAKAGGISVEHLRELNPALIRWSTPPGTSRHSLRVPAEAKTGLLEALARIPPHQRVAWVTHRIRKGETAPAIAKRYGSSLQALLEMNGLKKRQPLKPGGSLIVLASAGALPLTTVDEKGTRADAQPSPAPGAKHTVKKGETVAQIARAYGLSSEELQHANGLSRTVSLRPGQTLKVPASAAPEASASARKNLAHSVARPLSGRSAERKYTVKRGDTLAEIAREHRVLSEDLRRWNGLSRNAPLRPGQILRILDSPS
jgi:membrane-bound lytic murein transglycosylase D